MTDSGKNREHETHAGRSGPMARLRRYFLTGILVTAPVSITIYLTYVFLKFVDTQVYAILPNEWYRTLHGGAMMPGLGIVIALTFFTVVGWFATNFMGRLVIRISEYVLHRVPVINTLYKGVKQVFETVMGSQAQAFREVVLLEYPRAGSWTLGFVTGPVDSEIHGHIGQEVLSVFVPTAPSPVNGFLLFVPRNEVVSLRMSVEDGIKMVVSVGMISPSVKKAEIA